MSKPSTPAALLAIENAMEQVERAQNSLERACQDLSAIRYGADLYKKAGKLQRDAQSFWYKLRDVSQTRGKMSVDSEPES